MKKLKTPVLLVSAIILLFSIGSCKKDDSGSPSLASTLSSGTWKVSFYYDKDKDETSDFNGYSFSFLSGGTLNSSGAQGVVSGVWVINGSDDSPGSQKLTLFAGTTDPLLNLNDDWVLVSSSDTRIELKDDSNNNELLHFTKN